MGGGHRLTLISSAILEKFMSYRFDRRIVWIVIALQASLFFTFYSREVAWYPPLDFDQAAYLIESYRLEESVFANGTREISREFRSEGHFSGLLLPIEGALMGLCLGGARFPQLCVNFLAFILLQVFTFTTLQEVYRRRAFGYAALGLILCQNTVWFWAGGLFDFRIDCIAYCLYGVWVLAVIRSNLFLDSIWAIGAGFLGAFLVLHRFLTFVYLFGVCIGFAVACTALGPFWRRDHDLANRLWRRFRNLGFSAGVLVVIVAPVLIHNHKAIHDYYIVGHAQGNENALRSRDLGILTLTDHLLYYPTSILKNHLGSTFLWGAAIAIAGVVATRLRGRRGTVLPDFSAHRGEAFLLQTIFLLGAIIGPVVVLSADIAKSPVVGGIVGVPVALLVITVAAQDAFKFHPPEHRHVRKFVVASSLIVFGLGIFNQFDHATRHLPEYNQQRDLIQLADLDKWLVAYANKYNLSKPKISFDVISSWLNAYSISASSYEQAHHLVEFQPMLGGGIMGVDQAAALSLLAESDVVVLTNLPKNGFFPFYQKVAQYWDDLKVWTDDNLVLAKMVQFADFHANIYVRPTATISGLSGVFVTSAGISVEAQCASMQQFPKIQLSGAANYELLPKVPSVLATIETDGVTQLLPASFQRNGNGYSIIIDTSSAKLPHSDSVRISLKFDTFFVPQKLGINNDGREIVIMKPNQVKMVKANR